MASWLVRPNYTSLFTTSPLSPRRYATSAHTGFHSVFGALGFHEDSGVNPNGGVGVQEGEAEGRPTQRGSPRGSTSTQPACHHTCHHTCYFFGCIYCTYLRLHYFQYSTSWNPDCFLYGQKIQHSSNSLCMNLIKLICGLSVVNVSAILTFAA